MRHSPRNILTRRAWHVRGSLALAFCEAYGAEARGDKVFYRVEK